MRAHLLRPLLAACLLPLGCASVWPAVVQPSPSAPLFHSEFPLSGAARLDGALCSLATVGPDATLLVRPPEQPSGAVPLARACDGPWPAADGWWGRAARLVDVATPRGLVRGYLYGGRGASGVVVAFSGLGMPAAGWVNQRLAERAALRGLALFAPIRDESARPIFFDPLREARGGLEAALAIRAECGLGDAAGLGFVGISMGGLEALLAGREGLARGLPARAAVLDPVLDVERVTAHLDGYWHGAAADAMQAYFRRILAGRYGEPASTSFGAVMQRLRLHPEAQTRLDADDPRAWLCQARPEAYAVFLSDTDPVLGDAQRQAILACGFPWRRAGAPGHTPLACRLELFDDLVEAALGGSPPRGAQAAALGYTGRRSCPPAAPPRHGS
jgi:hypothetical protein